MPTPSTSSSSFDSSRGFLDIPPFNFQMPTFGGDISSLWGGSLAGFGGGGSNAFLDTTTGRIVTMSQIQADPTMAQAFQGQFGAFPAGFGATLPGLPSAPGTPPTGPTAPRPPGSTSPGPTAPVPNQPGPNQPSWFRDAQGNLNWGNILAGGAAGIAGLGGLAGIIQALTQGGQTSRTVNQAPPPTAQQVAAQQQGLQNLQGAGQFAFGGPGGAGGTQTAGGGLAGAPGAAGGTPGGLAGLYAGQQPFLNAAFLQALQQQAGQIHGNPFLGQQLPQQLAGQVGGYGGAQGALLGLQGLGAANLGPQIAGAGARALQGSLPPLSPDLMNIINRVYAGGEAAIQSEADTALTGALEQARQQGFSGGLDVFRQGTPSALLAPGLSTATRERAQLEGQRAQTIFGLMQGLPQMGGALATQGQGLLNQAAGAYTTPFSVALQGGQNLSGLNQNMIQSLLGAGYQGLGLQNQFLGALGGQAGTAGALSNAFQPLGGTQFQTQPFNLLSAMAPTANLLGGIGGVLSAMGQSNRPQINFQLPGGTTAHA